MNSNNSKIENINNSQQQLREEDNDDAVSEIDGHAKSYISIKDQITEQLENIVGLDEQINSKQQEINVSNNFNNEPLKEQNLQYNKSNGQLNENTNQKGLTKSSLDKLPQLQQKQENQQKSNIKNKYKLFSIDTIDKINSNEKDKQALLSYFDFGRDSNWLLQGQKIECFPDIEKLKILVVTWNLHGQCPANDIKQLFNTEKCKHHLIAIGTQECQRSILASFFFSSKEKWEQILFQALGNEYILIDSVKMNALHLALFAHISIHKSIKYVTIGQEPTGILNIIGNKGGVAINIIVGNKSILFINCHLSSGQDNVKQRNNNYYSVEQNLYLKNQKKKNIENPLLQQLNIQEGDQNQDDPNNQSLLKKDIQNDKSKLIQNSNQSNQLNQNQFSNKRLISNQHDYIFWLGDLNYRINQSSQEKVVAMFDQKDFFKILLVDQLLNEKEKGNVLQDFKEAMIFFPPTYKLMHFENKFSQDRDSRIPGWTDRILFKEKINNSIEIVNYECGIKIHGSDHRPIFAQFLVDITINTDQNTSNLVTSDKSKVCQIF